PEPESAKADFVPSDRYFNAGPSDATHAHRRPPADPGPPRLPSGRRAPRLLRACPGPPLPDPGGRQLLPVLPPPAARGDRDPGLPRSALPPGRGRRSLPPPPAAGRLGRTDGSRRMLLPGPLRPRARPSLERPSHGRLRP